MKLSTLHANLKTWLQARLPGLNYETYEPAEGQLTVLVPPPKTLTYSQNNGAVFATAEQAIILQIRLTPKEYGELDHTLIAGIYQGIAMELLLRGTRVHPDIEEVTAVAMDMPIAVRPAEDQRDGQVVTLTWASNLTFTASPESPFGTELGGELFGTDTQITPENITLGLWKTPVSTVFPNTDGSDPGYPG